MLLVCLCREHHDDSDGVHGEWPAGLLSQSEYWGVCLAGTLLATFPSLTFGFSCFAVTETRGAVHRHPTHLHAAGYCLWHGIPGRDGLCAQKPCCPQGPREQQPGMQDHRVQTATGGQDGNHLLHHGELHFHILLSTLLLGSHFLLQV